MTGRMLVTEAISPLWNWASGNGLSSSLCYSCPLPSQRLSPIAQRDSLSPLPASISDAYLRFGLWAPGNLWQVVIKLLPSCFILSIYWDFQWLRKVAWWLVLPPLPTSHWWLCLLPSHFHQPYLRLLAATIFSRFGTYAVALEKHWASNLKTSQSKYMFFL